MGSDGRLQQITRNLYNVRKSQVRIDRDAMVIMRLENREITTMFRCLLLPDCLQRPLARCLLVGLVVCGGLQLAHVWRQRMVTTPLSKLPAYQLDVNRATWEELMQLPRMGETMARRIVANREANGPFYSTADLARVPGIGPATVARLQPHLAAINVSASNSGSSSSSAR